MTDNSFTSSMRSAGEAGINLFARGSVWVYQRVKEDIRRNK